MKKIYIREDTRFNQDNSYKDFMGVLWFSKKIKVNDIIVKKIKIAQLDKKVSLKEEVLLKVYKVCEKFICCDIVDDSQIEGIKNADSIEN